MVTAPCPHHWIITESGQRYSRGVCQLCREERDFDNAPPVKYQWGQAGIGHVPPRKDK